MFGKNLVYKVFLGNRIREVIFIIFLLVVLNFMISGKINYWNLKKVFLNELYICNFFILLLINKFVSY